MYSEYVFPLIVETSVTSDLVKDFDTRSRGRWQMCMNCTNILGKVPDIQLIVFGTKRKSSLQKVQNLKNEPFLVGFLFYFILYKS